VFFIAYCFTYFVELFIASLFQFRINCDKQLVGVCLGFFRESFTHLANMKLKEKYYNEFDNFIFGI
jgi:hypothetical protein